MVATDPLQPGALLHPGEMAGFTANSQEAVLKPAAHQILIKFAADERGQVLAMACQFGLELRPVLTPDVVEQGGFGPVAYVCC